MNGNDEDSIILEELRTLDDIFSSSGDSDDDEDESPNSGQTQSCKLPVTNPVTINDAHNINQRLITSYKLAEAAICAKIKECQQRQKEVDYQIQLISRGGQANWKIPYVKAGMPYFKDIKLFPAPKNQDVIDKKTRGEISVVYFGEPHPWTTKARNILAREVRKQAAEKTFIRMKRQADGIGNNHDIQDLVPSDWEKIGPAGPADFDWLKISTKDLKSKHTWTACWTLWNLHLNDRVNNGVWTNAEDDKLERVADGFECQDWDAIAMKLGTGRNGYQCFLRYHTCRTDLNNGRETSWSTLENKILIKCIDVLRIGDIIPWGVVASYIDNRTKNQVYTRWKYNLDPTIKKGRFTPAEDKLLMIGIEQYGKDYSRIAAELLPGRTSIQINGRYTLLKLKEDKYYCCWSITEDRKLLALYEEFGPSWSTIATIMKKDRTVARHRYASLRRYMAKGYTLTNINRKIKPIITDEAEELEDMEANEEITGNNVDVELLKYFQTIKTAPTRRPGRRTKYHTAMEIGNKTRTVVNIFKKLNVNFQIPTKLDTFDLSEKEKQILISLREFMNPNHPRASPEEIENLRKKMFESNKATTIKDNTQPFIPSASFSYVRERGRKRTKKQIDPKSGEFTIDLIVNGERPLKNLNLDLNMEFETPVNVQNMINENELLIFDKLTSLVVGERCDISGKFETKFIPTDCFVSTTSKSNWENNIDKNLLNNAPNDPENLDFEPCYSTLLGYKSLLDMRNNYNKYKSSDNDEVDCHRLTDEGKQAFLLFRNRFTRLFKYPIGLARISSDKMVSKVCTIEADNDSDETNNQIDVDPLASADTDSDCNSDNLPDSEEDEEDTAAMAMDVDVKIKEEQENNKNHAALS